MDNPGPFQLTFGGSAGSIVGSGTIVGDVITGFAGVAAATFQAQFLFGGGTGTVALFVQTSIDQGQTWTDIASFAFTDSSATDLVNLSGLTAQATPIAAQQQALTAGTTVGGILGDRFRAVVVVTGAYNNSTLLNVAGIAR